MGIKVKEETFWDTWDSGDDEGWWYKGRAAQELHTWYCGGP